jgi:hypothetical protein
LPAANLRAAASVLALCAWICSSAKQAIAQFAVIPIPGNFQRGQV